MRKIVLTLLLSFIITMPTIAQQWVEEIRESANNSREFLGEIRNTSSSFFGQKAPDITFTDLETGEVKSLSDYAGKPVLLVFMRSTCSACIDQLPIVEDIHGSYEASELQVLHISAEDAGILRRFKNVYRVESPVGMAESVANFPRPFQISVTPSAFVIDSEGNIHNGWLGVTPYHVLVQSIDSAK